MSFSTEIAKSVSDLRVLVQLDIGLLNTQWVNAGAGIWYVNFDNIYPEVDSSLLDGFSAQTVVDVGNVRASDRILTKISTLAALTDTTDGFYWDKANSELWICLQNYTEPYLEDFIIVGVIYGYSRKGFTPVDGQQHYQARLLATPQISESRDPLFFGRLQYSGASIRLANADGELDTFAQDNNVYGNEARIYLGFPDLDIDDYQQIYTGFIENIAVGESEVSVSIRDKRKQLTRPITYTTTAANALDAIKDILVTYDNVQYTSDFFDTTAWAAATSAAENVTINMQEPGPINSIIQDICVSTFGFFFITPAGLYSFRFVDTSATAQTTFAKANIRDEHNINYDPTEVISSIRIGYDRDWVTTGTQYTYYTYDDEESDVFEKYKTYKERPIDTYLPTLSAATALATTVFDYSKDVHGIDTVRMPLSEYAIVVGDIVNVVVDRRNKTMLGTKACEIVGKTWQIDDLGIDFTVRFVS